MSHRITKGGTGLSLRLLLIAVVLAVWEAGVRYFDVAQYILPPPSAIFQRSPPLMSNAAPVM